MKPIFSILFLLLINQFSIHAQSKPKLVVGIVVDQMRPDYLYRYFDQYGEGGFKKLLRDGYNCKNTHYNYVPTYTGPGHSSVYTGCTPSSHGIVGNNWFSREKNKIVYCTEDQTVNGIGNNGYAGKMSARNQLSPTVGDELIFNSQHRSKVIGLALKDRAAILPAGHAANAAYWYDNGIFISSDYYLKELPAWVLAFNQQKNAEKYLSKKWETLLPIEQYTQSMQDDNKFEGTFKGELKPIFPHDLPALMPTNGGLNLIRATPFGNSITTDFAMASILGEQLGKDEHTDLLAISYSSTDYVGHQYGIDAIETQDCYLRMDRELSTLIEFLDKEVGKDQYIIFLTADHAGVRTPSYLQERKTPAGYNYEDPFRDSLKTFYQKTYGDSLVIAYINQQFYLSTEKINALKLNAKDVYEAGKNYLLKFKEVSSVYTKEVFTSGHQLQNDIAQKIAMGFDSKRCGDLFVNFYHGYVEYHNTGTTHGSPYDYDTHVPLLFYGAGIKKGEDWNHYSITDIAPTVSALLNIPFPGGVTGKPIVPLLQK
jgi:predicted AlkP superfamily pyrophosphatase or phosphodiesterase